MRLRFTIRDLLWLTLVVAMGAAWWIDRTKLAARVDNGVHKIAEQDRKIASLNNVLKADKLQIQALAQPRFLPVLPRSEVIDTNIERAMMGDPFETRQKMREYFGDGADWLVPDPSR